MSHEPIYAGPRTLLWTGRPAPFYARGELAEVRAQLEETGLDGFARLTALNGDHFYIDALRVEALTLDPNRNEKETPDGKA